MPNCRKIPWSEYRITMSCIQAGSNKYMEEKVYGQSTQPLYVLVDGNEKVLNTIRGYNASIPEYIKWLDEGIANYKK